MVASSSSAILASAIESGPRPIEAAAALTALGDAALPRITEIAERMVADILAGDELYGDLIPRADLLASCRLNAAQLLHRLCHQRIASSAYRSAVAAIGQRRLAQGLPLDSLLHAYRIGARVLWEELVHQAQGDAVAMAALASAATELWEAHDASSLQISEAYRDAVRARTRIVEEQQHRWVDQLVDRRAGADSRPVDAAAALGLRRDVVTVVVVIDLPAPCNGARQSDLVHALIGELNRLDIPSAWRPRARGAIGVVQLGRRGPCAPRWCEVTGPGGRIGISPAVGSLSELPEARRLADCALSTLAPGTEGVAVLEERVPEALLAANPELSGLLVDTVLGAVLRLPDDERDDLLDVVDAYLDGDGTVTGTAEGMHYHRNTVLKRLRCLRDITGRDVSRPADVVMLSLAMRALHQAGADPRVHGAHARR